jgi:hypothetical protein
VSEKRRSSPAKPQRRKEEKTKKRRTEPGILLLFCSSLRLCGFAGELLFDFSLTTPPPNVHNTPCVHHPSLLATRLERDFE